MISLRRSLRLVFIALSSALLLSTIAVSLSRYGTLPNEIDDKVPHEMQYKPPGYNESADPKPLYLPQIEPGPPIEDNFPLAANARSPSDLPSIVSWNRPPKNRGKNAIPTPLFIGFTRNWRLLQQAVVSYMTAGWPPSSIYVVDNTGTMHSNRKGQLSLQNPFYLDHHRLTKIFGINVLTPPTLLTFAQLQNFYTFTALENEWEHYFWAHMDTVAVSDEEYRDPKDGKFRNLYERVVEVLEASAKPEYGPMAARWFAYDRLTLVRTQSYVDVGGWDTLIPFYKTDCDMHERIFMTDLRIEDAKAGLVWDLEHSMDDLAILYKRDGSQARKRRSPDKSVETKLAGEDYKALLTKLDDMQREKLENPRGRNTWQARQQGGQGEPFYRDSAGFQRGIDLWMSFGSDQVFAEKWGRSECNLIKAGMVDSDAWHVVKDWENPETQRRYWRDKAKEGHRR